MEAKALLLSSQEPATGPYLELNKSTPHFRNPISLRSILILSSLLHLDLSGFFPSGFQTKILYTFLISPMYTFTSNENKGDVPMPKHHTMKLCRFCVVQIIAMWCVNPSGRKKELVCVLC
jgi:hypothetical protein